MIAVTTATAAPSSGFPPSSLLPMKTFQALSVADAANTGQLLEVGLEWGQAW